MSGHDVLYVALFGYKVMSLDGNVQEGTVWWQSFLKVTAVDTQIVVVVKINDY